MNELVSRPSVLSAVDAPKPWGWEQWLTSTRPEAPTSFAHAPTTLAALVAAHPEVLGMWTRRLFGEAMPIFAKLIHTHFPPRVHLGFRRAVEPGRFLHWLEREQELLRHLFTALRVSNASSYEAYHSRYSAWASRQALGAWRIEDDASAASEIREHVDPSFEVAPWLRQVRENRAAIVDTLNEIDLGRESGQLLLSGAGVVHAIFGLSHQTHPLDRTRAALQTLFVALAERVVAGASDETLAQCIDAANLPSLRAQNLAPPKNEAWFPAVVDGVEVLVEPQQTSDTTYSLADFYTPLTWSKDHVRFRKGAPERGIARDDLKGYLADVDFAVTPIASIRCSPKPVAPARAGAVLSSLIDEPTRWPFFSAYQLDLDGRFTARPPPGVFQQLVVTRGRALLSDDAGPLGELSARAPGFIPATLQGTYTLASREPSTVLMFAVPGARGGAPRV